MGLGPALELTAIRIGLSALERLPPEVYVSVNVSPDTILSGDLPTRSAACRRRALFWRSPSMRTSTTTIVYWVFYIR